MAAGEERLRPRWAAELLLLPPMVGACWKKCSLAPRAAAAAAASGDREEEADDPPAPADGEAPPR